MKKPPDESPESFWKRFAHNQAEKDSAIISEVNSILYDDYLTRASKHKAAGDSDPGVRAAIDYDLPGGGKFVTPETYQKLMDFDQRHPFVFGTEISKGFVQTLGKTMNLN